MNERKTLLSSTQPSCSRRGNAGESNVDFSNTCRTCLRGITDDNFHSIDKSVNSIIEESAGVVVLTENEDKLPQQICNVCFKALHFAYAFRQECQKVDALLKSYAQEKEPDASKSSSNASESDAEEQSEGQFENINALEDEDESLGFGNESMEDKECSPDSKGTEEKKFVCRLCGSVWTDIDAIIHHYMSQHVTQDDPSQCPLCSYKLKQTNAPRLRNHILTHVNNSYECQYCSAQYKTAFGLKRHLVRHTGVRLRCSLCTNTYTRQDALKKHLEMHHKRNKYECEECHTNFYAADTLKLHLQSKDNKCGLGYSDVSPHKEQNEFPDEPLNDDQQPRSDTYREIKQEPTVPMEDSPIVKTESLEDLHNESVKDESTTSCLPIKREHSDDMDSTSDDDEDEDTEEELDEDPHSSNKSEDPVKFLKNALEDNEPSFSCIICSRKCQMYRDIIDHYVVDHDKGNATFTCPFCNEELPNKGILRTHLKAHITPDYKCQYCDGQYKAAYLLRRHLLTHTGKRPFSCTQCSKRFKVRATLNKHVLTHDKRENFTCDQCHRQYSTLSSLQLHCRTHNSIKELQCSRCSRQFMTKYFLRRHEEKCLVNDS